MTTYETRLTRSQYSGIQAETQIMLNIEHVGTRHLKVLTFKGSRGGLNTSATVVHYAEDGRSYTFAMFSDFSKTIATSPARATEKAVRELHAKALVDIAATIEQAKAHYAPGSQWAEQQARDQRHRKEAMASRSTALEGFADPMHY